MRRKLESIKEFHEALTNNPNFRKRIWDNGTECLYKEELQITFDDDYLCIDCGNDLNLYLYKSEIDSIIEERNILFGKEIIDYVIKLKESKSTIEFG